MKLILIYSDLHFPTAVEPKKGNPMDEMPKGTFDLEEWKRFYSNNEEVRLQHYDWIWMMTHPALLENTMTKIMFLYTLIISN